MRSRWRRSDGGGADGSSARSRSGLRTVFVSSLAEGPVTARSCFISWRGRGGCRTAQPPTVKKKTANKPHPQTHPRERRGAQGGRGAGRRSFPPSSAARGRPAPASPPGSGHAAAARGGPAAAAPAPGRGRTGAAASGRPGRGAGEAGGGRGRSRAARLGLGSRKRGGRGARPLPARPSAGRGSSSGTGVVPAAAGRGSAEGPHCVSGAKLPSLKGRCWGFGVF